MNEIVIVVPLKTEMHMKNNETILSDKFDTFFSESTKNISPIIDVNQYDIHQSLKSFTYPISIWPVIVNDQTSEQLSRLSTRLPGLLYQIPKLYFNNNIKDIADFYFNGNEQLTEFAMMCHDKNIEISCRLDLTYTEEGYKVLEINTGSSIGGWQLDNFEEIVRNSHKPLKDIQYGNYAFKSIQSTYINFLIDKIQQYVPGVKDEINVFIASNYDMDPNNDNLFDLLLKQELQKRGLKGGGFIGKNIIIKTRY